MCQRSREPGTVTNKACQEMELEHKVSCAETPAGRRLQFCSLVEGAWASFQHEQTGHVWKQTPGKGPTGDKAQDSRLSPGAAEEASSAVS